MNGLDADWDGYLSSHPLGPQLLQARIENLTVTLHPSELNAYEWVARGPDTLVQARLDGVWEALQVGASELIIGLLPEGVVAARARVGDLGEEVPVHVEPQAYWLVAPLAQEVTLTFTGSAGDVIWEHRIHAWHHAHPIRRDERGDEFGLSTMALYRLGEPLATVRVGESEVTIHRQEGTLPNPFGAEQGPPGTLWAITRFDGGGGAAGPLIADDNWWQPSVSDPGCVHVGEDWRVFAGTVPPSAVSAEAVMGGFRTATIELTPELFYVVVPSAERVMVTIRDAEGEILARHELPVWRRPKAAGVLEMVGEVISTPGRVRAWFDSHFDLPGLEPNVSYMYSCWGGRTATRISHDTTLRGMPPQVPEPALPGCRLSAQKLVVPGVALLVVVTLLLRWVLHRRGVGMEVER